MTIITAMESIKDGERIEFFDIRCSCGEKIGVVKKLDTYTRNNQKKCSDCLKKEAQKESDHV